MGLVAEVSRSRLISCGIALAMGRSLPMEAIAMRRVVIPLPERDRSAPGKVILVVSQDDDWRKAAARTLSDEGYDVIAVTHSGHAVLAGLTTLRLDMVITEWTMDDMTGPALVEQLRRHHPDVRALFFGPFGAPRSDDVLARPFTRDDLLERLQRTLVGTC